MGLFFQPAYLDRGLALAHPCAELEPASEARASENRAPRNRSWRGYLSRILSSAFRPPNLNLLKMRVRGPQLASDEGAPSRPFDDAAVPLERPLSATCDHRRFFGPFQGQM
jgi:hypothetical protein